MKAERISTDVLIIGGGTAGCYAAIKLGSEKDISVVIAEKANISRSGCLASGVNALNAYITSGHKPEDYVEYASNDAEGIVRKSGDAGLHEVAAQVFRQKAVGGEKPGRLWDKRLFDAHFFNKLGRVKGTRATEGDKAEVSRIIALRDSNVLYFANYIRVGNGDYTLSRFINVHTYLSGKFFDGLE